MKKIISLAFIIMTALFSCKKEDTKPVTKTDYLTSGTWAVTDVVSDDDGDGTYETHDFPDFVACYTDNIYTFHSDGKWEMNEGASKCDPGDPQSDTALWQLINNEKDIILGVDTYSIVELSNTKLQVKLMYEDNRSSQVTFTKR